MRTQSGQKFAILITIGWLAVAPYAFVPNAFAQEVTPPAPDTTASDTQKTADGEKDPVKVTVKGHKKQVKPADRDVYDVSQDPATKTGTIADTLRKIPGVFVDPAGHVSLHGKAVTLMVDGRPSLILSGDNQGAALRAMPSSFISSVEVITSPGAEFGSEGSGGIINLVTNRHMPAGGMVFLSAQTSSTGGDALDSSGSYHAGKLTAQWFVDDRRDFNPSKFASTLADVGSNGQVTQTTQTNGTAHDQTRSILVSGQIQYELTHDDILGAKVQVMDMRNQGLNASQTHSFGVTKNLYTSAMTNASDGDQNSLTFDWLHYGQKPDEKLTVSASLSHNTNTMMGQGIDSYILSSLAANTGDRTTTNRSENHDDGAVFNADYAGPVWDDQLHLGVEIHTDSNRSADTTHFPDPLTAVAGIVPLTDSRFSYRQTLSAAYVTYQKEFGEKWTVLGGLRAETLDLDTDFVSLKSTGHLVYTRLNPSLFATYVLSPKAKLVLSYTRRLQRPSPRDLNPYVILVDATHVSAGNPNLQPQNTEIFEARYAYSDQMMSLTLRGFYNRDEHLIAASSRFIADPQNLGNLVQETTSRNYGFRADTGVEASYTNQLAKTLFVMLNTTVQATRLRNPDIPGAQSGTAVSGMLSLNYNLSPKTGLFLNYNAMGRQLTGQGYVSSSAFTSLGLFHALTPKLNLSINVNDLLRTGKSVSVIDTTTIHSLYVSSHAAPTFMISLNRSFSRFASTK